MRCEILELDRTGNGPIRYSSAGRLPPEHFGFERSKKDAWLFVSIFPLCDHRAMRPITRPCGSINPRMLCEHPRAPTHGIIVVPDQCWECPFKRKASPPGQATAHAETPLNGEFESQVPRV